MKIPKPRKRGETYRIEIMFDGKRYSCTRDTTKECEQWAAQKLLGLKAGTSQEIKRTMSFYDLFEKYYREVGSKKKTAYGIAKQLKVFRRKFGGISV